jgi:aspartate aminotransferase
MELIAERITRLAESETLQMAQMSREMKAKGFDIIDLSLGEPDFDTPQHIKDAAKKAIDEGYTKYTPVSGYLELRQAIANKFKRDNQLDYTFNQIVVSTGAKQSLSNVMMALLNPGDEVIIPSPYWVSYREMVKMADGKMITIKAGVEQNFKITAKQLEAAITPKTKILCYSSPCNPTGAFYSKDELKAFAGVLSKHPNIFIVADEIYEYINYTGKHESIAQFPAIKDRVIIVNGCSKAFAMTGWRIGYIAAPAWIAKACEKIQGQVTSGTCSISQRAALAALTSDLAPTFKMRDAFHHRRDLIYGLLKDIPGLKCTCPDGAFYMFPDVSSFFGKSDGATTIKTSEDLSIYLLNKAHVAIVTGAAFGDGDCMRISYAASDEKITEGIKRIKTALSQLK